MLWVQMMHRLSLTALLALAVAAAACRQQEPANDTNAVDEPVLNLPAVPRPRPPLDRASLLSAVAEAASATAAGAEMPESVRSLDGRQFEIRIRFGCRGPATDLGERWLGWSFDPEERRIRVRAAPTISRDDAVVAEIGGEDVEAVEGFWLPRPWLLQPVCPAAAAVAAAPEASGPEAQQQRPQTPASAAGDETRSEPVPTAPRIGIAQFFTRQDPRTRRRDMRPYQAAHALAEGQAISSQGYNLVLSGRLRDLPGRGVINCVARAIDAAPDCVVSAEFLRVWIEQPGTREVIAEWSVG
jgi:hypothetical protein